MGLCFVCLDYCVSVCVAELKDLVKKRCSVCFSSNKFFFSYYALFLYKKKSMIFCSS